MDCLDREVLQQLAWGELPPEEAAECEAHLRGCERCTAQQAALRTERPPPSDDTGDTGSVQSAEPSHVTAGLAAAASPAPMERGTGVGRYLILEKLGQGGMGEVYAAFDPQLNRKVALKLLLSRASEKDATSKERLLREAQAMAQLSHPNVLPVHDAGEFEGRVFIAMELVEGMNLREWLKAAPRAWPEVVRHFLDAGRGLAAAHRAGLVHRDFKPDNVMLGQDGRVYVMDFGLARPGGERSGSSSGHSGSWDTPEGLEGTLAQHTLQGTLLPTTHGTQRASATGLLGSHLTQAGGIIGTPGYMAPEQIRGEGLDARADAFAFCASLYYGLYGHKPFAGKSPREVLQATQAGKVQPPPRDAKVPAWLRRVLLKGLSVEREQRYPDVEALLQALQANPAVRRRRYAMVAGALALLASAVAVPRYLSGRQQAACEVEAQGFAQTWGPERQAALERAFRGTGVPYADTTLKSVNAALDAYATGWRQQRADACLATRVRREASKHELALRTECLDRRRQEAGALLDVLVEADAKMVEKAVTAVSTLSPLEPCADLALLLRQVKPPDSPEVAAQVAELRSTLTRSRALIVAGQNGAGLKMIEPLVARSKALGYKPLEAEVLSTFGNFQEEFGQHKEAQRTLRRALALAEGVNHDEVKVRAVQSLAWIFADDATMGDEARQWCEWAIELLSRIPHSQRELSRVYNRLGWSYVRASKLAEAEVHLRKALELGDATGGPDSMESILALNGLGVVLSDAQRLEEARSHFERLGASMLRVWGADHPRTAILYGNTGRLHAALGDGEKALEFAQRTLALFRKNLSPKHPNLARAEGNIATALILLERYPEALEHARQAVHLFEGSVGAQSPELVDPLLAMNTILVELGRPAEALPHARRAMTLAQAHPGAPYLAVAGAALGLTNLELGRHEQALALLETALPQLEANKDVVPPGDIAYARFLLARARWELGRERPEALHLAQEALASMVQPGAAWNRAKVEAWLAKHP